MTLTINSSNILSFLSEVTQSDLNAAIAKGKDYYNGIVDLDLGALSKRRPDRTNVKSGMSF